MGRRLSGLGMVIRRFHAMKNSTRLAVDSPGFVPGHRCLPPELPLLRLL